VWPGLLSQLRLLAMRTAGGGVVKAYPEQVEGLLRSGVRIFTPDPRP